MGKVTRVEAKDATSFDALVAAHAGKSSPLFVLFCGEHDQADGTSWCSDCNEAAPVIDAGLEAAECDVTLIEVPLARAAYKGNASHWARVHPAVKLQRVPTLFRWGAGKKPVASLVEDQAKDRALVAELVSDA